MFAYRLKALRKERGLTLQELAKQFNMSHSTLSKYETGNRRPDMQTLKKLAEFFNVSVDYLIGESPVKNPAETVYITRANALAEDLPQEAKQELEQYIEYLRHKYADKR